MDQTRFKALKIVMQRAQINNCPIAAVKTTLYKDTKTGKKLFVNEFHNKGSLKVESFSVRIACFDEHVQLIGTIKDYRYKDIEFYPGTDFGQEKLIACPSDSIASFAVSVIQVELEGDRYWDETTKAVVSREPEIVVEMAPVFEDSFLPEEHIDEPAERPVSVSEQFEDTSAQVLPETLDEDLFSLNQGNTVNEFETLQEEVPQHPIGVQNVQSGMAEPVKEAETVTAVEPVQEAEPVKEAEQTEEAEQTGKIKKKKRVPKAVKLILGLIIVAALLFVAFTCFQKYNQYSDYNRGAAFMANGQFEYAISCYSRLGNYMDSPELLKEAKQCYADSLRVNGQFEEAIKAYQELGSQEEMIAQCYDEWAKSLYENGSFEEAYQIYLEHKDAVQKNNARVIKYEYAVKRFEEKAYSEVVELLEGEKYGDSEKIIKESYYNLGTEKMSQKDYPGALSYFEQARGYGDTEERVLECNYQQAMEYMDSTQYDKAVELFELCGDYKETAVNKQKSYYLQGTIYENNGGYEEAVECFAKVMEYEDSKDHYNSCLYRMLLDKIKEDVTAETMELFEEIPKDYADVAAIKKTLNKYVDYVGEYEWTTSNDKEINEKGGFEEHLFVKLSYDDEVITFTLTDDSSTYPVDQKSFAYKSDTESNTYTMLNTTTITRTFNGKIHTYKKVKKD
ncbi:MAG: tetratricopeptide repeat protein [Lachnospiraceae bacterium]